MQTGSGPHTLSPQGSREFAPVGTKGAKRQAAGPHVLQKQQGAAWGAWLPGEQPHERTSLSELTAPGVSSPVTRGMWWTRAPSCWTLPSVCPGPIATPLGSSVSSDSVFLWSPCSLTQSCLHFFPSPLPECAPLRAGALPPPPWAPTLQAECPLLSLHGNW